MKRSALYWGALAAIFSSAASATPMLVPNLGTLARESNLVVVGRVESTSLAGYGSTKRGAVSIVVDRVLAQASPLAGGRVDYEYSYDDPDASGPAKGVYGVFLLKCAANGACRPASAAMQFASARPEFAGSGRLAGNTTDLVAAELLNVIARPDGAVDLKTNAVRELSDLQLTPTLRDELLEVTRGENPAARIAAAAVLLAGEDTSAVATITPDMVNPPRDCGALVSMAALNVRSFQNGHASSLESWSRWLQSSSVDVRRAGASALRSIRSKEASTVLAKVALDDPDKEVLFSAVSSLILNVGDARYPTMDRFEKDPEFYRHRWQAWRAKNLN